MHLGIDGTHACSGKLFQASLTCSPDFGSLTVVNELKMPTNIFKKGTLILIFLHDTSVPVVQRNYLKLHTVPSPSLERKKYLVNDFKFNFSYLYHYPVTTSLLGLVLYALLQYQVYWAFLTCLSKLRFPGFPSSGLKTVHHYVHYRLAQCPS